MLANDRWSVASHGHVRLGPIGFRRRPAKPLAGLCVNDFRDGRRSEQFRVVPGGSLSNASSTERRVDRRHLGDVRIGALYGLTCDVLGKYKRAASVFHDLIAFKFFFHEV